MKKTLSSLAMPAMLAMLTVIALTGCSSTSGTAAVVSSSASPVPAGSPSVLASPSAPTVPAASAVPSAPAASPSLGQAGTSAPAAGQTPVAAEHNPPGDIPDNIAFVPYDNAAGHYRFTHPEGWAESSTGSTVTFTDKLNGVTVAAGSDTLPPTEALARQRDVPQLTRTQPAFQLTSVKAVTEAAGTGVLIVYRRNSPPDPVTGREYRDEVQRYELVGHGRSVVVEFFGPVGADNVDAYRTMVQSLRLS